jgi:hypothetical protein
VLSQLAGILRQTVRDTDLVARYGGEEFVLLLPAGEMAQVTDSMERIRRAVEVAEFRLEGRTIRVTVSRAAGRWTVKPLRARQTSRRRPMPPRKPVAIAAFHTGSACLQVTRGMRREEFRLLPQLQPSRGKKTFARSAPTPPPPGRSHAAVGFQVDILLGATHSALGRGSTRTSCLAQLCALASLLVPPVAFLSAADWTGFRGPTGQGISEEKGLPVKRSSTENIVWKVDLPGPGASSPIVVGDKVFVTAYSGYGLKENTGDQKDLRRHLLCFNRKTGDKLWDKTFEPKLPEHNYSGEGAYQGYAGNTPVSDGERLYVFFGKSGVYCFDLDGNEKWHERRWVQRGFGTPLVLLAIC